VSCCLHLLPVQLLPQLPQQAQHVCLGGGGWAGAGVSQAALLPASCILGIALHSVLLYQLLQSHQKGKHISHGGVWLGESTTLGKQRHYYKHLIYNINQLTKDSKSRDLGKSLLFPQKWFACISRESRVCHSPPFL
jgi:hypothetical protein